MKVQTKLNELSIGIIEFLVGGIIGGVIMAIAIFSISRAKEWIGFWGSVVGGIVTIIGVYMTLNYEKEKQTKARLEKMAEQIPLKLAFLDRIISQLAKQNEMVLPMPEDYNELLLPPLREMMISCRVVDNEIYKLLDSLSKSIIETTMEYYLQRKLWEKNTSVEDVEEGESFSELVANAHDEIEENYNKAILALEKLKFGWQKEMDSLSEVT